MKSAHAMTQEQKHTGRHNGQNSKRLLPKIRK